MTEAIDPCLSASVSRLREDLLRVAARELVAVYIHGSAVLGDFVPGSSDLDVLVVAHDDIEQSATTAIADALATHDPTPAVSIEASVVTRSAAGTPRAPWPYVVHVTNHPDNSKVVYGADVDGDPDLILHYAVLRQCGWTAYGTSASDSIGEIDRATIIAQLTDELSWAAAHAPGSYAVLNACRALRFVSDGVLCSKSDGGRWALSNQIEPELVNAALVARQSGSTGPMPAQSGAWVRSVAGLLRQAGR
jgi:hypothetical protein